MPEWAQPSEDPEIQALAELFERVANAVATNPSPEVFVGMSLEPLREHAAWATQKFVEAQRATQPGSLLNTETWDTHYMIGFVVGMYFEKERSDGGTDR